MASISNFLGALRNGAARPNRFECIVNFPVIATNDTAMRDTPFLVSAASLPGSTLGKIEAPFRGRTLALAGDRTFDDWSATFYNTTDFALRNAFETWHNMINNYSLNVGQDAPAAYLSTVGVYQLDSQDNRIKTYVLRYAWPLTVGSIELDQSTNDTIETFEVSFAFSDVISDGII